MNRYRCKMILKFLIYVLLFFCWAIDPCGGPKGSGYDAKLIDFLISEAIPATLFISGKWINANPDIFQTLARNPLFGIENHGLDHKTCSAIGQSVYGIRGTKNVGEIYDEV